jgi:hypothetical protein
MNKKRNVNGKESFVWSINDINARVRKNKSRHKNRIIFFSF